MCRPADSANKVNIVAGLAANMKMSLITTNFMKSDNIDLIKTVTD